MQTFCKHATGWFGLVTGLSLMITVAGARADDRIVGLDQAPAAVGDAVRDRFPDAQVQRVEEDRDHGRVHYDVDLIQNGREIDLKVAPDGTLLKIERDLDPSDLPRAIVQAVKDHQFGTIQRAEETIRGDYRKYELVVASGNQRILEVDLDAQGRILDVDDR